MSVDSTCGLCGIVHDAKYDDDVARPQRSQMSCEGPWHGKRGVYICSTAMVISAELGLSLIPKKMVQKNGILALYPVLPMVLFGIFLVSQKVNLC